MKIEFFHDVICSYCFPMSARMRAISEQYPGLEIVHRSFALTWRGEDYAEMYGSWDNALREIVPHWAGANENDEAHRFNIDGMLKAKFRFPTSRPGLIAAKAAGKAGGDAAYWAMFDALQKKLFVENQDLEDPAVVEEAAREVGLDLASWRAFRDDPATERAVLDDVQLAQRYGVNVVPALVIDQKYLLSGALAREDIEAALKRIADKEGERLEAAPREGAACTMTGGQWHCP